MPYHYRVTLEETASGTAAGNRRLVFDTTNHDDLFSVVDRITAKSVLPDDEVAEFSIGLKMFSEIIMRHRGEPLFQDLFGQVGTFIKKLKNLENESPTDADTRKDDYP